MQVLKESTITETVRLNRLCWFGHVQRMEEDRIPKRVLYMNLETTRLRGRPRNRWQDEVREDEQTVGGKEWQEKLHNREEWKKLLRMARNLNILHMPMEWMNVSLWCLIQDVICITNFSFLDCSVYSQTPCVTVRTVPEICSRGVCSTGRGCAVPPAWLWYGHPRRARLSKDHLYERLWGGCLRYLCSAAWMLQRWYSVIRVYKMNAVKRAVEHLFAYMWK